MAKLRTIIEYDDNNFQLMNQVIRLSGPYSLKTSKVPGKRQPSDWSLFYKGELVRSGYKSKKKAITAANWEDFCGGGVERKYFTVSKTQRV